MFPANSNQIENGAFSFLMVILFLGFLASCFSVSIHFFFLVVLARIIQFLAKPGLFCMLGEERSTNRASVLISSRTERK